MRLVHYLVLSALISGFTVPLSAQLPAPSPTTRSETRYTPTVTISPSPALPSETAYNPNGTHSTSKIGLISLRRDDPEYRGFLLGMQDASLRRSRVPLNVAPLSAATLEDQITALQERGVTTFLFDSPNSHSEESEVFLGNAEFLGLPVALITQVPGPKAPKGTPYVVTPYYYGTTAGEVAIRHVGNNDVTVGYILPDDVSPEEKQKYLQTFKQPFTSSAQKVNLVEIDSESTEEPKALVLLDPTASLEQVKGLRSRFPNTFLVAAGESEELAKAFKDGVINARVRPDYDRIYLHALRELSQKSDYPVILNATADVKK